MILINNPANEAIVSNVSDISEFTIKATAKSFQILSNQLYANKIRAIVREISCNAYDSHVAAGKPDLPFDLHLPTRLEPWFAVRDYGVGLSEADVKTIYTGYFTSTKTNSNDFVGALGLGSKSPFSYTNNFTVTAIKDGVRGIYTAYINDLGVPSIAKMFSENTTEPNGVEVKVAVEQADDFRRWADEASSVFSYFRARPTVNIHDFRVIEPEYESIDVIPGVHVMKSGVCRAVMGNIEYPIVIPNAKDVLGDAAALAGCSIVMEFPIGALDFQASREGLSYIPTTVEALKKRFQELSRALFNRFADDANSITNLWERADFIKERDAKQVWKWAAHEYIKQTKFPLLDLRYCSISKALVAILVDDARDKYNVDVIALESNRDKSRIVPRSADAVVRRPAGPTPAARGHQFTVGTYCKFFIEDCVNGTALVRQYYNTNRRFQNSYTEYAFVLSRADKSKPMDTVAFLASVHNPPENQVINTSLLTNTPPSSAAHRHARAGAKILEVRLQKGYSRVHWGDGIDPDGLDSSATYAYFEMSGFKPKDMVISNYERLMHYLRYSGVPELEKVRVFGVRVGAIDKIKKLKNFVHVDTVVKNLLAGAVKTLGSEMRAAHVASNTNFRYNSDLVAKLSVHSPLAQFLNSIKTAPTVGQFSGLRTLAGIYGIQSEDWVARTNEEIGKIDARYPLLAYVNPLSPQADTCDAVAHYVNLIDQTTKV